MQDSRHFLFFLLRNHAIVHVEVTLQLKWCVMNKAFACGTYCFTVTVLDHVDFVAKL